MRYIIYLSLLIIFSGCSSKHYDNSTPKILTLKTQKLKHSDTAYLRYDESSLELELYSMGSAIEKISIDRDVCVSAGCMSRAKFNSEYLSSIYPDDTIYKILTASDIFGGLGKNFKCDGTVFQHIRDENLDILYRRAKNETYFKDRLNNIIIKIEDLE